MRQIVHIFKKDVRRHWPEILLSLAAVGLFAWNVTGEWRSHLRFGDDRFTTVIINVGTVVSWWVLVVRVIQGESLAGDRQFWITRPYDWKKLLAAKMLFILFFVYVPVLIVGTVLLTFAGFNPVHYLPRLLAMQMPSAIAMMLLPAVILAAVTPSFAQFALGALGIGAYVGGMAALSSYIPSESFGDGSDNLQIAIVILGCIGAILWQYSRRKTVKSRLLLAATAFVISLLVIATPYEALVAREYPPAEASKFPVAMSFDRVKRLPEQGFDYGDKIPITIPLNVSSEIAEGSRVEINGAMLKIEGPGNRHWNSGWSYNNAKLVSGQSKITMGLSVDKKFFDSVSTSLVNAHLSLAMTVIHDKQTKHLVVKDGEFFVPELGFCSLSRGYLSDSLECRSAFGVPSSRATMKASENTCPLIGEDHVPLGLTASASYGGSDPDLISPIEMQRISFSIWEDGSKTKATPDICPGTAIDLTEEEKMQRATAQITLQGIKLDDYRTSNIISGLAVRR